MNTTITLKTKWQDLENIGQQIGQTPLLDFSSLTTNSSKILAKAEWMQLGQSVKARPAYNIIRNALLTGQLEGRTLLDASSGNTAIAYAAIAARLKIPVAICLPGNASEKRKQILKALGAELHFTSPLEGTDGAQDRAQTLSQEHPDRYFYADQYSNEANWQAHYFHTAEEIIEQTKGYVTHFVCGLGTTGSITGNGKRLKEWDPSIEIIGLQPDQPMHGLEGWKHLETARIPAIYDDAWLDHLQSVSTDQAIDMVRRVAKEFGWLLSPSSGANLYGAMTWAEQNEEAIIVTLLPDDLSKYDELLNQLFL